MAKRRSLCRATPPSCDSSRAPRMISNQAHKSSLSPGKNAGWNDHRASDQCRPGRCRAPHVSIKAYDDCPLWVKSGHRRMSDQCPLYSRKRASTGASTMSPLRHKRTSIEWSDSIRRNNGLPLDADVAGSRCAGCKPTDWQQILAMMVDATKCGDTSNPRRTDAELSPPGESNVPNHPGGGDQTADNNSLTIPTFLAARPS